MRKIFIVISALVVLAAALAVSFAWHSGTIALEPGAPHASSTQEIIAYQISQMPLRDKVAGLLVLHVPGTDPATLEDYVERYHPAGLILMGDNIPATLDELRVETAAIEASTSIPYLIATDEEGCTVARLGSDTYACPEQLGNEPVASTSAAFAARSALLKSVGINLNFGIIADVTSDPSSFIYPRVFGGDPATVAPRVAAAVSASQGLTLSTIKHFPGHGETPEDSHATIPLITISQSAWQERDEPSFAAGVSAGANVVMFGHLIYSAVDSKPASLSAAWHNILAQDTGFTGIAITDDMIMLQQTGDPSYSDPVANAVAALSAGNDLLLYVNDHEATVSDINIDQLIDGIVAAVQNGQLSESDIDAKLAKVLAAREATASFN